MGCKTIVEQLNESLGKNMVNTTDTLPVVENDTLYRVNVGDLATSLGLTGAITGLNDGGAIPVLTGTAPNYQIRGILGGNGITAQQNINGNITLSTNFINAGGVNDGERLIPNTQSDPLKFKRLKAGAGIVLTPSADSITITNSQSGGDIASKEVIVSKLSDFPAAIDGVITLADNIVYNLINDVATTNRFVMGSNTVIRNTDPYSSTLTYTGTGAMFTTTNGTQSIHEISLDCPNGTLFDTTGNTTGNLLMRWVRIISLANFGVITKPIVGIYNVFIQLLTGSGITFGTQTDARTVIENFTVVSATDATLDLIDLGTATFDVFSLNGVQVLTSVSGQTFLKGAAGGNNITGGNIGFVSRTQIEGDMVGLDTVSVNDAGWDFTDNNIIPDTRPNALLSLDAGADTTISVAGTAYQVAGAFTSASAQLYTVSGAGLVTYNGRRDKFATIDVTISFEPASGINKDLFLQIAKNNTVIGVTKINRTSSSGSSAVVSLDWALTLSTGDTVAIYVGNDTDTTNITVHQMLLRVA